jgi:hypothetical protein
VPCVWGLVRRGRRHRPGPPVGLIRPSWPWRAARGRMQVGAPLVPRAPLAPQAPTYVSEACPPVGVTRHRCAAR